MTTAHHEKAKRHGREHARRILSEEADRTSDKRMVERAIAEHEHHDHPGKPLTKLRLRRGGRTKKIEGRETKRRLDRAHGGRARMKRQIGGATPGVTPGMPAAGAAMPPRQPTPQQIQQLRAMQAQRAGGAGAPMPTAKKGGRVHRADGGRMPGGHKGGKGGKGTKVNIINMPGGGGGGARPVPVPVPARRPAMAAPPARPVAPPPGAMPPRPGMPPVAGMGGAPMPGAGIKRGGRARA
jgi:hypothetical protein